MVILVRVNHCLQPDLSNKLIKFKMKPLTLHSGKIHLLIWDLIEALCGACVTSPTAPAGFSPNHNGQSRVSSDFHPADHILPQASIVYLCMSALWLSSKSEHLASGPELRVQWVKTPGTTLDQWRMGLNEGPTSGIVLSRRQWYVSQRFKRSWQHWAHYAPRKIL